MSNHVTQQPMGNAGMSMGGNRNVKNLPVDESGRDWSNGLFECFNDPMTCVFSTFLPCIVYAKNKQRYEHLTEKGQPDPSPEPIVVNNDTIMHGLLTAFCGLGWVLELPERANLRTRYNIRGDGATDCVTVFFCHPCTLTQEAQELALEEGSFGGYGKA